MKKLILALIASAISLNTLAAISTSIKVPRPVSKKEINIAIAALQKASKGIDRRKNVAIAKKLLNGSQKTLKFNAAVYVNGNKQFNGRGDEVVSWNFSGYCYKGDIKHATALINVALKLGHWGSDEEWIQKAYVDQNKIKLLIMDGPNDQKWYESFGRCRR